MEDKIKRGKELLSELSEIIRDLPDSDILDLLVYGDLDSFMDAIFDRSKKAKFKGKIADFLFENRNRAYIMARLRYAITHKCSFKVTKDGQDFYVSPLHAQWFKDGVMFTEGRVPFGGQIVLYQNGEARYAVVAGDMKAPPYLTPQHVRFISIDEFKESLKKIPPTQLEDLDRPVKEFKRLLEDQVNEEVRYQELFEKYPWILGLQWESVQRHKDLGQDIPDFTGVRVKDKCRDIIEIKPPFMPLFKKNGDFRAEFNDAWNQAERYLNTTRKDRVHLAEKRKLRFDNPKCYLISGYQIPEDQMEKIRLKQEMNPSIEILTYEDLIRFTQSTIEFLKQRANLKPIGP